ncbi:MAG: hypothetical protein ACK5UT_09370, partial [Acidobacteriota bacterium]
REYSSRAGSAPSALASSRSVFTNRVAPLLAAREGPPHGLHPFYLNVGGLAEVPFAKALTRIRPAGSHGVQNSGDNVAQTPLIARAGEGHAAATLRFYTLIDF